jgi:hypothetical protein
MGFLLFVKIFSQNTKQDKIDGRYVWIFPAWTEQKTWEVSFIII